STATKPRVVSGEGRDHGFPKAAHRAFDALVIEITETHPAEEVANACVAERGDLLRDIPRGADERARAQGETDTLRLRLAGIGPGVQHGRVHTEIRRVQVIASVVHMSARVNERG